MDERRTDGRTGADDEDDEDFDVVVVVLRKHAAASLFLAATCCCSSSALRMKMSARSFLLRSPTANVAAKRRWTKKLLAGEGKRKRLYCTLHGARVRV